MVYSCSRPKCGGSLLKDLLEANVWICILCARRYMQLSGELVALDSRHPNRLDLKDVSQGKLRDKYIRTKRPRS